MLERFCYFSVFGMKLERNIEREFNSISFSTSFNKKEMNCIMMQRAKR